MQEIFGYDGKLVIIAGISLLTWIFLVAGTASPFATISGTGYDITMTLFEYCSVIGNTHSCDHTYGCSSVASTVHGGAAFSVMSILLWCVVCAITIGRIFKPAFFDRPQMPMIIYVSYGVTAFMLLIAWACAFGAFHAKCDTPGAKSTADTDGSKIGACGWLLFFAQIFVGVQAAVEWKMPNGKSASDNYNAVGSQPQHVSVAGGDNSHPGGSGNYSNSTGGNATGYADVSEQ